MSLREPHTEAELRWKAVRELSGAVLRLTSDTVILSRVASDIERASSALAELAIRTGESPADEDADVEEVRGIVEERTNDASGKRWEGVITDFIDYVKRVRRWERARRSFDARPTTSPCPTCAQPRVFGPDGACTVCKTVVFLPEDRRNDAKTSGNTGPSGVPVPERTPSDEQRKAFETLLAMDPMAQELLLGKRLRRSKASPEVGYTDHAGARASSEAGRLSAPAGRTVAEGGPQPGDPGSSPGAGATSKALTDDELREFASLIDEAGGDLRIVRKPLSSAAYREQSIRLRKVALDYLNSEDREDEDEQGGDTRIRGLVHLLRTVEDAERGRPEATPACVLCGGRESLATRCGKCDEIMIAAQRADALLEEDEVARIVTALRDDAAKASTSRARVLHEIATWVENRDWDRRESAKTPGNTPLIDRAPAVVDHVQRPDGSPSGQGRSSSETDSGPVPSATLAKGPPMQTEPIMQFFEYAHLPPHLQAVSKPFCELAQSIVAPPNEAVSLSVPRNAERTVALRKLLEAKDAAVRAVLFKEQQG